LQLFFFCGWFQFGRHVLYGLAGFLWPEKAGVEEMIEISLDIIGIGETMRDPKQFPPNESTGRLVNALTEIAKVVHDGTKLKRVEVFLNECRN